MQNFSVNDLQRATVVDSAGEKVGAVTGVYLDDATGQPDWVTVNTGFFGTNNSFIPLQGATLQGEELRVPHTKQRVKDAPNFDADHRIEVEDERVLYDYYGVGYEDAAGVAGTTTGVNRDRDVVADRDRVADRTVADRTVADRDVVDRDVTDGETAVRREERLHVDKDTHETGRARLRKYVETDTETVEVPVKREKLVVDREPVRDGDARNVGVIGDGDTEEEIVLREERVNVSKETVGVEKVRVGKETVQDTEVVTEDVKKERIDVDVDGDLQRDGTDVRRDVTDVDRDGKRF